MGSLNPKDQAAAQEDRVRLDLLEPAADEAIARALAFGADKYGVENFKTVPIRYRSYLAAMRRHINALLRGEDVAPDSLQHHLAHIGANVHVLMSAAEAGTLIDDRGPAKVSAVTPTPPIKFPDTLADELVKKPRRARWQEIGGYTNDTIADELRN